MGLFSCFSAKEAKSSPRSAPPGPKNAQPALPACQPPTQDIEAKGLPSESTSSQSHSNPDVLSPSDAIVRLETSPRDAYEGAPGSPRTPGDHVIKPAPEGTTNAESLAQQLARLRPFTDETTDGPVHHYLLGFSKHGAPGLLEAMDDMSQLGDIFGAAYRLNKLSMGVVVNGENALMLAAMGADVLRALDAAAKKDVLTSVALEGLLPRLQEACEAVAVYGRDGWLLHMACNDHIKSDFDGFHAALVDCLEGAALEVPGRPAPLPRGHYLEANRNFRRCLKRIGGGSASVGLKNVAAKPLLDDQLELAAQLGVSAEAVGKELAALPAGEGFSVDAYYNRMVARIKCGPLSAGERYKAIFDRYDKECVGYLDRSGLQAMLADLGDCEGMRPAEVEALVKRAFGTADQDGDGRISPEEFGRYYDTLVSSNARKHLRMAMGKHVEEELKDMFEEFCSFGTRQAVHEMDSAHFAKLFKDCNLLGKDLSVTDTDLAFARAKPKGARKLNFESFVTALSECAERRGSSLEGLVGELLAGSGPVARATKADHVRLHDDKSTYTGVYAKGGPKVMAGATPDLAAMLDRSDAAGKKTPPARSNRNTSITIVDRGSSPSPGGVTGAGAHPSASGSAGNNTQGGAPANGAGAGAANNNSWKRRSTAGGGPAVANSPLYEMWALWAQFGSGSVPSHAHVHSRLEMGVTQWIKLLRDCGLLEKGFNASAAELIFVRVRTKGSPKISFEAFEKALGLVAENKAMAPENLERAILASSGPIITSSRA